MANTDQNLPAGFSLAHRPKDWLRDYFLELEKRSSTEKPKAAVPPEFGLLAQLLPDIQPGNLVLVCGGRVTGKTQLLLQMGVSATLHHGIRTVIHAPATDPGEIHDRIVALASGVELRRLQNGMVTSEDWNNVVAAASRLTETPLILTDDPAAPLDNLIDSIEQQLDELAAGQSDATPGLCCIDGITRIAAHGLDDYGLLGRTERTIVAMLRRWLQRSGHVVVASVLGLPDVTGARDPSGAPSLADLADAVILLDPEPVWDRELLQDKIVCRIIHRRSGRRVSGKIRVEPWSLQLVKPR